LTAPEIIPATNSAASTKTFFTSPFPSAGSIYWAFARAKAAKAE